MKSIQKWSVVGLVVAATALVEQNPGIQRTVVHTADVSVPGREAVIARVEIVPGATAGRHKHPGDEISYVLEGGGGLLIECQSPRKVKAGVAYAVPARLTTPAHKTVRHP